MGANKELGPPNVDAGSPSKKLANPTRGSLDGRSSQQLDGKSSQQTAGQLEREVSQKVQALYKQKLGHQTGRVTCQLFDSKVAIILENSITRPIELLLEENQREIAEQIRNDLNSALHPLVIALISSILDVEVIDLLSDTSLSTGRTAIVGVLSSTPTVRNPEAIPKAKKTS